MHSCSKHVPNKHTLLSSVLQETGPALMKLISYCVEQIPMETKIRTKSKLTTDTRDCTSVSCRLLRLDQEFPSVCLPDSCHH